MINQKHKDRLFSFIFGREENKAWTLSLYNAVNGTDYEDPQEIEITTIEDILYMSMKNDLSFLLDCFVNLYEQQSTFNPNMPVRMLMYLGKLYDKHIHKNHLKIYGKAVVQLPVPKFVVFYNGKEEKEEEILLKLSDAFPEGLREGVSDVEVTVRMLNINFGKNRTLMEKCRPLTEYSWLVDTVRRFAKTMAIETAVDAAIEQMPDDFEIRVFLISNKAEVRDMCLTEYNEEETLQMIREEALDEGRKEGRENGIKEGREEGREETLMNSIRNLMGELKFSAEKAMAVLKIPTVEQEKYLKRL